MKTAVVYFSASGTTEKVAKQIAQVGQFDCLEIRAKDPYTDTDLNWRDDQSRSSLEQNDPTSRPAFVPEDFDLAPYGKILLGFPIWWDTAPKLIRTFLEAFDWTGKEIILFATSGSSGFGTSLSDLKESAKGAIIKEGQVLNHVTNEDVAAFVKEI